MKKNVTIEDLHQAAYLAVALARMLEQPAVLVGALAMRAHGYQRETSDVDIVLPVIIGDPSGDLLEITADQLYLQVKARHSFGGLDLRTDDDLRIDVLTLDKMLPELVPAAIAEAVDAKRTTSVYGVKMYFVSIGYLITFKLAAERKKDLGDVVELIKSRMEDGEWDNDKREVESTVRQHLGWHGARRASQLAAEAKRELFGH